MCTPLKQKPSFYHDFFSHIALDFLISHFWTRISKFAHDYFRPFCYIQLWLLFTSRKIHKIPCRYRSAQAVKIFIALAVFCTFGLQFFVCVEIAWNGIKEKFTKRPTLVNYVMRYEVLLIDGTRILNVCSNEIRFFSLFSERFWLRQLFYWPLLFQPYLHLSD